MRTVYCSVDPLNDQLPSLVEYIAFLLAETINSVNLPFFVPILLKQPISDET